MFAVRRTHPVRVVPHDRRHTHARTVNARTSAVAAPGRPAPRPPRAVHAGDLRLEAWARTREACIAEAASALAGSFAGPGPLMLEGVTSFEVSAVTDEELLRAVLLRVIEGILVGGRVPVWIEATATHTGLRMRCGTAETAQIVRVGAVPRSVAPQGIRCERTPVGWRCRARIDV